MSNIDINTSELVNFLIKNKEDIETSVHDASLTVGGSIELYLKPKQMRFSFREKSNVGSTSSPIKQLCIITKDVSNSELNNGIYVKIKDEDFEKIKETFLYTHDDLELEVKSMLRGDKLDDVLKNE